MRPHKLILASRDATIVFSITISKQLHAAAKTEAANWSKYFLDPKACFRFLPQQEAIYVYLSNCCIFGVENRFQYLTKANHERKGFIELTLRLPATLKVTAVVE